MEELLKYLIEENARLVREVERLNVLRDMVQAHEYVSSDYIATICGIEPKKKGE